MMNKRNDNNYHLRIEPDEQRNRIGIKDLFEYKDLVILLTQKAFKVTYQQTIIGPLWIIINPILSSLIYMFIFGHIASIGTDGIPMILFYFVSSSVWELFSFSLQSNANTFITNAYLFSKVYFPRLTVPISNMFVSVLKFCVQLVITAVIMVVFLIRGQISPNWMLYPLLPLLFIQMSVLGMSIGILVSSVTTKYRDLLNVVNVGVSLLMYASPIVYPISSMPDGILKLLVKINPTSEIVELIRMIMLGKGEFDPEFYFLSIFLTVVLFVLSSMMFNKVERTFADRI